MRNELPGCLCFAACAFLSDVSLFMFMQVNFLTKLVSLRPGKTVHDMIKNVMLGKEEGAESSDDEVSNAGGIAGRVRFCFAMISLLFKISKSFFNENYSLHYDNFTFAPRQV